MCSSEPSRKSSEPCLTLNNDDEAEFVVLKDMVGVAQVLVIPTKQISGIESPDSRKGPAMKYWSAAWNARFYLFGYLQREIARDEVSLAVNSQHDRSQTSYISTSIALSRKFEICFGNMSTRSGILGLAAI